MSKLNSHNLDVQRMLNVLSETLSKIIICSLFSYETLDDNIEKLKANEEIKSRFPEILPDILAHQEKVNEFHDQHIIIPEDPNANDKASVDEEENYDEDGQQKDKENQKKEFTDLTGLDRNSPAAVELAKSIRNFCRKYYHDKEFIKAITQCTINDIQLPKNDDRIAKFLTKFETKFKTYYEKCVQMTLEEELSESNLNVSLKAKIHDLKTQIDNKKDKLAKLKNERLEYNTKCSENIAKTKKEIDSLKKETTKSLNKHANEVNEILNKLKEENDVKLKNLKEELEKAKTEMTTRGEIDNKEELSTRANYTKARNGYLQQIQAYDNGMNGKKAEFESLTKEKNKNEETYKTKKVEFDALESKYNFLKENFLLTQQKCKDVAYDEEVKQKAVEWMQGQFRGFMTRKQLRKKYKFLNVLRAPKKIDPEEAEKGKKGKKGKK